MIKAIILGAALLALASASQADPISGNVGKIHNGNVKLCFQLKGGGDWFAALNSVQANQIVYRAERGKPVLFSLDLSKTELCHGNVEAWVLNDLDTNYQ